jgi:hypothetical protein
MYNQGLCGVKKSFRRSSVLIGTEDFFSPKPYDALFLTADSFLEPFAVLGGPNAYR